jgi:hypothetical protein
MLRIADVSEFFCVVRNATIPDIGPDPVARLRPPIADV